MSFKKLTPRSARNNLNSWIAEQNDASEQTEVLDC